VRNLYGHHFTLKPGTRVYVPTPEGEERGNLIKQAIEDRWSPPSNYFHLQPGGHVAAVRRHKDAPCVASLDLRRFFDQVTRSKVHRALKAIGIPHADAWEMACDSTVDKRPPQRSFSIPFGFIQSPAIASLVLARSSLGRVIQRLDHGDVDVSVYVDDIIVSGAGDQSVINAIGTLAVAAEQCGFEFNAEKANAPGPTGMSFNIEFGSGAMRIVDDRMSEFELAVRNANSYQLVGILGYVDSVNAKQQEELSEHVTA
jgi:hypothetical protein